MFNSRVKLFGEGKIRSKWKGPYTIVNTSSHGAITLQDDDGEYFKVNGHRLKNSMNLSDPAKFSMKLS